jgi:glucosamine--fructose-6-phosphate aminotransferase (isomerizing)
MCGIVGYVGPQDATHVVMAGLRRLEYRGYDSAGVAVVDGHQASVRRRAGKIKNLDALLLEAPQPRSGTGIGHTRWATHGGPTDRNAHPHSSENHRFAVVHNGIIENHASIRRSLEKSGYTCSSDTDTEVAAHLLAALADEDPAADTTELVRRVARKLEGAFTLVVLDAEAEGVVVGARRNSPLVVGRGDGENFLASDVAAFIEHTRDAVELGQDQVVTITREAVTITDFDGKQVEGRDYHVNWDLTAAEKSGYRWFMFKEIEEQPRAIADTLLGRFSPEGRLQLDEMRLKPSELRLIDKIIVVACGTAFYAGLVAKYAIEHWTRIPCEVELASEFRYRDPIVGAGTLVVAISQSGETADTLMAIRHAQEQRARVLAICNTNGSTIPREADGVIYTHAGPEIGVASTKGFSTQLVACYLLGLFLAQERGTVFGDEIASVMEQLHALPAAVRDVLDQAEPVRALARELAGTRSVLFLGRHAGYPVALEGALKLKELAYIHAEGFAAGELKHGPIALIEEGLPVFVIVPPRGRDQLRDKVISNVAEVRARGARTIVLAEAGDDEVAALADTFIPLPQVPTLFQPLVAVIPLQIFAGELADALGHDVDQPRNLAKSVTVE